MAQVARLDWLAKVGFAARGFVYILLGWIALRFRSKADEGQNAVWATLRDMPAGYVMLLALVLGLLAYAAYRIIDATLDMEGDGTQPKAIGKRIAHFASGLAYCSLAYTAADLHDRAYRTCHARGSVRRDRLVDPAFGVVRKVDRG